MGMGRRRRKGRTDRQIDRQGNLNTKGIKRIWTSLLLLLPADTIINLTDSDYQLSLVSVFFLPHMSKLVCFHESSFYVYHWAYGITTSIWLENV